LISHSCLGNEIFTERKVEREVFFLASVIDLEKLVDSISVRNAIPAYQRSFKY